MKFADPKNDIAFKKIFGDEKKTEVLISFLNSILEFKGVRAIKSVTIANPYQVPKIEELKNTILDIRAINQSDEEFIVEMQVERDIHFAKRSLYYTSKSYVNQIKKAEDYPQLKKVYFIGILDFAIFEAESYISRHLILDQETLKQEVKDFEFNFIELKKFKLGLEACNTIAKKWIYFIQNAENFDLIPKEYANLEAFTIAFESAKIYNWSQKELDVYDYVSMQEGKRLSEIETARIDGEIKGKIKGKIEGKIEAAKLLKSEGVELAIISKTTGLSLGEIELL
ncbi:MAG: Rpn family recombination-promoting nuclease/putative transposase [Gammaproteobacteria bacterium]|jgi:predicted transposase/invertase (TIGR01784 family)|nr:Rpn family recombination-promoting nuclease/putative transposase [Gammaproteobacteria bacterium]MBT4606808.1 Rpn family recombination-promoting nuclease/putative transposase [Thiotrichales bacterium]MBT4328417.1 Rpn family recombination-promoting nuclease/putative transposase [Gammaproteobacteria bacterium]MBT5370539.1 Rpn family recombination-promoting nuclease/putative transposase [Gammaproteobacteria bacterium]MBT7231224.1 Rpn family recombination-promoting nuclease/putative transposase [